MIKYQSKHKTEGFIFNKSEKIEIFYFTQVFQLKDNFKGKTTSRGHLWQCTKRPISRAGGINARKGQLLLNGIIGFLRVLRAQASQFSHAKTAQIKNKGYGNHEVAATDCDPIASLSLRSYGGSL